MRLAAGPPEPLAVTRGRGWGGKGRVGNKEEKGQLGKDGKREGGGGLWTNASLNFSQALYLSILCQYSSRYESYDGKKDF